MFPLLYHTHHSLSAEDIPFWLQISSRYPDPILELGCGTGRVFKPLWDAGHKIIGLDNDYAMLSFLKKNTWKNRSGLADVFQADCTQFSIAARFGLVLMPCNTYSTLDAPERCATLHRVKQHLLPGGAFVFSMPNPTLLSQLRTRSEAEIEDTFYHPVDQEPVQVSSAWRKTRTQFILTWHYDHLLPNGLINRTSTEIMHYLASPETLVKEIQDAGLTIYQTFGDYDQSPYTEDAENLIIIALRS